MKKSLWALAAAPALLTIGLAQPAHAGDDDDGPKVEKRVRVVVTPDGEHRVLTAPDGEHRVLVVPGARGEDGKPRVAVIERGLEDDGDGEETIRRLIERLERLGDDRDGDLIERLHGVLRRLGGGDDRDRDDRARPAPRRDDGRRRVVERVERRDGDRAPTKVKIRIQVGDQVIEEEFELEGDQLRPRRRDDAPRPRLQREEEDERRFERPADPFRGGPFRWREGEREDERRFFLPAPRDGERRGEDGLRRLFEEGQRFFERRGGDRREEEREERRDDDRPRFFFERRDDDRRDGPRAFRLPFGDRDFDFDFDPEHMEKAFEGLKGLEKLRDLEKLEKLEGLKDLDKTIEKALRGGFEGMKDLEEMLKKLPPEARKLFERREQDERRERDERPRRERRDRQLI